MATLNWIGKEKVINHHLDVPFRTLKHKYTYKDGKTLTDGTLSENKIIHGDNLEALKSLLPEYEGKVKCIYIDPPYNTGNEGWVYNDNVNHPKIKKWLGEVVGKEGEDLSRHDKWLCMMYPRLKLLHKLLSEDGAICISIDDNEQAVLKLIMDEIFGKSNFVRNIIWHKRYAASNDARGIPDVHDFILIYQKSSKFSRNLLPRTEKQNKLYKYDSNDGKGKWRPDNLTVKTYSEAYDYPITNPNTSKEYYPTKGRCWATNRKTMSEWIKEGRVFFGQKGDGAPQLKRYLSEVQSGIVPVSYWSYDEVNHTDGAKKILKQIFNESNTPFQTPKPVELVERIITLCSEENSIILDSFAGSGTTAHAVLNLNKEDNGNRKFIMIELEDYANDITAERVKRVIDGYVKEIKQVKGTGGDFAFLDLGEALFDQDEYINENQPTNDIRKYVYYSETRTNRGYSENPKNDYYLGKKSNTAYYFYYRKDAITTLDLKFASDISIKADQYIVYADKCTLPENYMDKHNIVFKKIPRDIAKI